MADPRDIRPEALEAWAERIHEHTGEGSEAAHRMAAEDARRARELVRHRERPAPAPPQRRRIEVTTTIRHDH